MKIKIELDLAVVQEAIALEVRPAVSEYLAAHYDLKAMIAEELGRDTKPDERRGMFERYLPMMLYANAEAPTGQSLIVALVRQGIKNAADTYIKNSIEERGPALEAAFKRMMRDAPDRLVNAFADMIDGAEITLDLAATLAVKEPEPDYSRDC